MKHYKYIIWLGCLFSMGCGGGSDRLDDLTELWLDPPSVSGDINSNAPIVQEFKVMGKFKDGKTEEITRGYTLTTDPPTLGTFDRRVFSSASNHGGQGKVVATVRSFTATADVTFRFTKVFTIQPPATAMLPAVPDNVETLFGGPADAARAPTTVYPNDGVLLPPNLGRIELHWLKGTSNTLFEVSFQNSLTNVRAYMRCINPAGSQDPNGCYWEPQFDEWAYFAETNRGAEPLTMTIRATDDGGTGVGASAAQTMEFSKDDIKGTIYYWAPTIAALVRHDFAEGTDTFEEVIPKALINNTGKCVACHAVSRDGTKIATSGKGSGGNYMLYNLTESNVANAAIVNRTSDTDEVAQFFSFNEDGSQLVAAPATSADRPAAGLLFFKTDCSAGNTGPCQNATTHPLDGAVPTHPDWSADGQRIAFTDPLPSSPGAPHAPIQGGISFIEKSGDGWSGLQNWIARQAQTNFYSPNFAPDSSFIVFNQTTCPTANVVDSACDGYIDAGAKLRAVEVGKNTPIALAKANAQGHFDATTELANTFPRFSPFISVYKTSGSGDENNVMWLTFSTQRRYGLKKTIDIPDPNNQSGGKGTYLWMVAIRPSELRAGRDPSYPAFVLPFQDFMTSNHIGMWTTRAVPLPPGI